MVLTKTSNHFMLKYSVQATPYLCVQKVRQCSNAKIVYALWKSILLYIKLQKDSS